jgi:uncharacterized protein
VTDLAVAAIITLASITMAVSGFGFALVAVPLLAVVVGAETAVVADAVIGIGLVVLVSMRNRHGVVRRTVVVSSIAALAAMPAGLLVLVTLDDRALTATIGAVVVAITVALAFGLRLPASDVTDAIAGLVSGALATSTGTNGPPLVIALHGKEYAPEQFRATLAAIFLTQSIAGVALFAAAGRITSEVGRVSLVGYPAVVAGLLAGERIAARIDARRSAGSCWRCWRCRA